MLMALGVRLYFFQASPNLFSAECEDYSKIHLMLQWAQSPLWYPDTNFGPLHTVLLWATYKLTGSLVTGNRLMTLFFGLLMFLPVYRITRRRLGEIEALGATMFFAWMFPLTLASVSTLSEAPFVCFVLLGFDLIDEMELRVGTSWWRLLGAAVALNAASAMRFEVWALLPIIVIYIVIRRGWKEGLIFAVLLSGLPLLHMYESWKRAGHPLEFLAISAQMTALNTAAKPLAVRVIALPMALGKTIGWPGLVLGLAGLAWSLRGRRLLLPILCGLAMLAILEMKSINATIEFDLLRYTALVNALMGLFVAVPIVRLVRWRTDHTWLIGLCTFIAVAVAAGFSQANGMREIRLLEPTREAFALLEKLKPELKPDDRILIGSEYHPLIVVNSGLRWSNFRRPAYSEGIQVDQSEIARTFTEWKPTLILADRTEPLFTEVLKLPMSGEGEVDLFGRRYRCEWSVVRWNVWRLVEPAS
jgi:hypothetical protein